MLDLELEPLILTTAILNLQAEEFLSVLLDDEVIDVWKWIALACFDDALELFLLLISHLWLNPVDVPLLVIHLLDRSCELVIDALSERFVHLVLVPKRRNALGLWSIVRAVQLHVLRLALILPLLELWLQLRVHILTLSITHHDC